MIQSHEDDCESYFCDLKIFFNEGHIQSNASLPLVCVCVCVCVCVSAYIGTFDTESRIFLTRLYTHISLFL